MAKNNRTIEEGFASLQDILTQMENSDVTLEQSFKLYNDGIGIVKELNEKLLEVEGKLQVINE